MKILYALAGLGFGHATRSKIIIQQLLKDKHQVLVVCGGDSYNLLKKEFKTQKIHHLLLKFKEGKMQHFSTLYHNLKSLPKINSTFFKLIKTFKKFNPDIVISDFEPFTAYISLLFQKPCISICNQHISTNTEIKKISGFFDRSIGKLVTKSFCPSAHCYIIPTFFKPKIKKKNTLLVPTPLRKEILSVSKNARYKNYILVYLSVSDKNQKEFIIPLLNSIDENFILYGLNENFSDENIISKKFNEKTFIKDLANSKAILSNGGLTTISEAIFLQKPILSIPLKNHSEQEINSFYVQEEGFGFSSKELTKNILNKFLKKENQVKFRKNLEKKKKENNKEFFQEFYKILKTAN